MTLENVILLACLLVLIQIFIPIVIEQVFLKKINLLYLISSRDKTIENSKYFNRVKRALNNLLETLPIFGLLVILSIFKEVDNSNLAALWLDIKSILYPYLYIRDKLFKNYCMVWSTTCLIMMGVNFIY